MYGKKEYLSVYREKISACVQREEERASVGAQKERESLYAYRERGFEFVTFPKVDYKKILMIGLQLLLLVMASFLYQLLLFILQVLVDKR